MKLSKKTTFLIAGVSTLVAVITLTLVLVLTLGGGSLGKKIDKSLKSVKTATVSVAVSDGESLVYGTDKTLTFIEGGANAVTVTKKLEQNHFELKEETLSEFIANASAKDLISLNLDEEIIGKQTKSEDGITVKVAKEKANDFFGVVDAKANSDITVKFLFKKNKLQSIYLSYTLMSGRTVEITATYTY